MHLLRKCPCPVWLLKPESPKSYRRILAAVDVDDGYPPKELKTRHALNRAVARTGIPGFIMGNTAETILNRLDCSVLAIKPLGFETPVTLEDYYIRFS